MISISLHLEYFIGTLLFAAILGVILRLKSVYYKKNIPNSIARGALTTILYTIATLTFVAGLLITRFMETKGLEYLEIDNANFTAMFTENITNNLTPYDQIADYLAQTETLKTFLEGKGNEDEVNSLLDTAASKFKASVIYLMDSTGLTLASTNRLESDSFLGKNYAFRDYFQTALSGTPEPMFALGVTSFRRGYYTSKGVRDNRGNIIGVLAVKQDIENLNLLFTEQSPIFLVSDKEKVFFSSQDTYLFTDFYSNRTIPTSVTSLMNSRFLVFKNKIHLYSKISLHMKGWSVIRLADLNSISNNKIISLVLIILVTITFAVAVTALQIFKDKQNLIKQNQAQTALEESQRRFVEMANSLPNIIFEADTSGDLTFINNQVEKLFGYRFEDYKETINLKTFLFPEDLERARKNIQNVLQGIPFDDHEYKIRKKDGTSAPVLIHSSPIINDGKITGIRGLIIDISQQKRMEDELRKNEKLEVIGTLAGGIAHDFNNLLASIQNAFSIVEMEPSINSVQSVLKILGPAILRGKDLTAQMLSFSKGGQPVKKVINIAPLIEMTTKFTLSGSRVSFIFSIDPSLKPISADEGQISQVIQNIVINAKQAMEDGGTIYIQAYNEKKENNVSISISDEGPGIDPKTLEKIFEPFFTTKPDGNGLGLSICQTIIQNHGGQIHAEANPAGGTTFIITMPATAEPVETIAENKIEIQKGSGRILLMDDDPVLVRLGQALLKKLGYTADTSARGEETIDKYRESMEIGKKYDIVILDLTIAGGMGGKETLKRLIEIDPDVKAIVSSGYSNDPVMSQYRENGFKAVVVKPYTAVQLRQALSTIDSQNGPGDSL